MRLGTVYICVQDMGASLAFYRALLQAEPVIQNDDRWVSFEQGLSLYARDYDLRLVLQGRTDCFNQAYLDELRNEPVSLINHSVIFNFEVDDLQEEYERLQRLNIGQLSEIYMVNVHHPYYY